MPNKGALIKDWLAEQRNNQLLDWEQALQRFYPQYCRSWNDAEEHFRALTEDWNILDAAKTLDWGKLLSGADIRVLDLGCGTGWLAAYLSTFPNVKSIDTLDSSRHNLSVMMPELVRLMNGNIAKINPIWGLFYPLLVENGYYDIIVASCAVHHCDNLFPILKDCNRALKMKGKLVILNETPLTSARYCLKIARFFISVILCLITRNFPEYSPAVSRSGFLYDPYLGDKIYSYSQWKKALTQTGFSFEIVPTPYFIDKKKKNQKFKLSHFICGKA